VAVDQPKAVKDSLDSWDPIGDTTTPPTP